ncbi:RecBCD nuclease inhibitor [Streptomyces paludis]|uniref:RecBCD nuclease inhibitor n=1 Tax=Streptomyces paludis TaxID=2282738 RepID=A0A345HWR1_9ACTN|nr:RecBCD nuclease inhibitor [Streptomyces paludis]AXG81135.1 RecBCD nuclease inhibitor [Streptomyces paludis]
MAASNFNATWTLDHAEYQQLKRDSEKLAALERFGVDNWGGYDDAMQSLEDED